MIELKDKKAPATFMVSIESFKIFDKLIADTMSSITLKYTTLHIMILLLFVVKI